MDGDVPGEVTLLGEAFLAVGTGQHAVLVVVLHVLVQLDLGAGDVLAVAAAERLSRGVRLPVVCGGGGREERLSAFWHRGGQTTGRRQTLLCRSDLATAVLCTGERKYKWTEREGSEIIAI